MKGASYGKVKTILRIVWITDEKYYRLAAEKNSSIQYFIYIETLSDEDKMAIDNQANVKLPGEDKKDNKKY